MTSILFGAEEHVGAIGQTRTGKTTLFRKVIVPSYGRIVTIDSKTPLRPDGKTDFPNIPVATVEDTLKAASTLVRDGKPVYFNWRIPWGVAGDSTDRIDKFCYDILETGQRTAVYFDEVTDFSDSGRIPDGMLELIRKGGGLNLNFLWGSQRPQLVNKSIWNNTHHKFAFYVEPYDARVCRPYFPEVEAYLSQIPYGSHRSIYKDPSGVTHLLGPC